MNMEKALQIIKTLGVKLLTMIAQLGLNVSRFILNKQEHDYAKEQQEKIDKSNDELKDTCDNGSLKDLLDKFGVMLVMTILLTGCITTRNVEISTTRQWEGHYMSVSEFTNSTSNITLDEGESIWVLSNKTLYKLLEKHNGK